MSEGSAKKKGSARSLPECPLCLGRSHPLSTEDYLPQWLRTADLAARPVPAGAQFPPKFKTRICQKCNGHLNKQFENSAAPLLKPVVASDATVTWKAVDQVAIAQWVIKTDLMVGFACLPKNSREPARRALLAFMYTFNLDDYWSIRVGAMNPAIGPVDPNPIGPTAENSKHLIPVAVFPVTTSTGVQSIGWLQAEVLRVHDQAGYFQFIADTPDSDWWIRLWPVRTGEIQWPPRERLSFLDVMRMKEIWKRTTRSEVSVGSMQFMDSLGKHLKVRTGVDPA